MMIASEAVDRPTPGYRYTGTRGGFTPTTAYGDPPRPPRRTRSRTAAMQTLADPSREAFVEEIPTGERQMTPPGYANSQPYPSNQPHPNVGPNGEQYSDYPPEAGAYPDDGMGPYDDDGDDGTCPDCHHSVCTCVWAWFRNSCLFDHKTWQNMYEYGGVQAFKSPVDQGQNGNFGFHKAANWGSPLWNAFGIGYQLGGVIALSDFSGGAGVVNHQRDQYFVTTGLFRRAMCNNGLQGGAVLDYLNDNFYVSMNLLQIRGEISYLLCGHELGFWTALHLNSDTRNAPAFLNMSTVTWQANNQYNFFYRYRFCNGGIARTWIGWAGDGGVLWGSDATAPLSERWALQLSYNYLMPTGGDMPSAIKETWGLAMSLVWYPGQRVPSACFDPYRPLFSVADNSSLLLTQK